MVTETLNPPETSAATLSATAPSLLKVLQIPFDALLRPAAAARTLVAARPAAFWAVFALLCLAYGIGLGSIPVLARICFLYPAKVGFFEAWVRVNRGQTIGPVEVAFALGLVVPVAMCLAATWLMLTRTLRSEPVTRAAGRMFRAQVSVVPFVLALGVPLFALLVCAGVGDESPVYQFVQPVLPPEALGVVSAVLLALWLSYRVEVAGATLFDCGVAPSLPPRCEGCGYDLTHTAAEGMCTECGRTVSESLTPGRTRPGCEWENDPRRSMDSWMRATREVLVRPRHFYETLAMHTDHEAARRFATTHLRWIGLIAATWIISMLYVEGDTRSSTRETVGRDALIAIAAVLGLALGTPVGRGASWRGRALLWLTPALLLIVVVRPWQAHQDQHSTDMFWLPALALCLSQLVCWFGHRLGGAIVSSIAIFFRFLPDYRWAEKVILYESVMLWMYCVVWGVLASSFILFGEWMWRSPLFRWTWDAFGIRPEMFTVLVTTAALSIVWARRYLIAFRSVRWANF